MSITISDGLDGARTAAGLTVVIDTFRAFSTAAYAQAQGVGIHLLAESIDHAREVAGRYRHAVLCGEDAGIKPDDFDIGNSPAEILNTDLEGRVLVQRTSAGTRCVIAALASDASSVHPASLVVASATAQLVDAARQATIVACGRSGTEPVLEDSATAALIADLAGGTGQPASVAETIRTGEAGRALAASPWAHPDDLALCADVDRFSFALVATSVEPRLARLHTEEPGTAAP